MENIAAVALKTHLLGMHLCEFDYHCPVKDCIYVRPRVQKMQDHLAMQHNTGVSPEELYPFRTQNPAPAFCPMCGKRVTSCVGFIACAINDCRIPPPGTTSAKPVDQDPLEDIQSRGSKVLINPQAILLKPDLHEDPEIAKYSRPLQKSMRMEKDSRRRPQC